MKEQQVMSQKMLLIDHRPGGNADCMRVAEVDIPTPAADEVLIRVVYAGVNRRMCCSDRAAIRHLPMPHLTWAWKSRAKSWRSALL